MTGRITRIISNLYTVQSATGEFKCRARGKFRKDSITPLVGDFCEFDENNNYIMDILPRNNELKRPPIANVDIALIITSLKEPKLSLNLLDKLLSIITFNNITPVICFTKLDLINSEEQKELETLSKYYNSIGIKTINNNETTKLKSIIKEKLIVLTGQSGAGKSTLLNGLDPNLNIATKPISKALGRGVHTTRHVELFSLYEGLIADTPGFSSIDFKEMSKEDLRNTFPEFREHNCPFKDCMHLKELDCNIKDLVTKEEILLSRYENYKAFIKEMSD